VFAKTFEKVSEMEEYKDIEFKSLDVEEDEDGELMSEKFNIKSVPSTVLLDENDELIYKISGNISLTDFTSIINDAMKK
jgi:thioredoxin-related protein